MPDHLNERTHVHICIVCLHEVPAEEYFAGDYVCNACRNAPQKATHGDQHEHTHCCGTEGRATRGEVRA